jgi:hypothetical protein
LITAAADAAVSAAVDALGRNAVPQSAVSQVVDSFANNLSAALPPLSPALLTGSALTKEQAETIMHLYLRQRFSEALQGHSGSAPTALSAAVQPNLGPPEAVLQPRLRSRAGTPTRERVLPLAVPPESARPAAPARWVTPPARGGAAWDTVPPSVSPTRSADAAAAATRSPSPAEGRAAAALARAAHAQAFARSAEGGGAPPSRGGADETAALEALNSVGALLRVSLVKPGSAAPRGRQESPLRGALEQAAANRRAGEAAAADAADQPQQKAPGSPPPSPPPPLQTQPAPAQPSLSVGVFGTGGSGAAATAGSASPTRPAAAGASSAHALPQVGGLLRCLPSVASPLAVAVSSSIVGGGSSSDSSDDDAEAPSQLNTLFDLLLGAGVNTVAARARDCCTPAAAPHCHEAQQPTRSAGRAAASAPSLHASAAALQAAQPLVPEVAAELSQFMRAVTVAKDGAREQRPPPAHPAIHAPSLSADAAAVPAVPASASEAEAEIDRLMVELEKARARRRAAEQAS